MLAFKNTINGRRRFPTGASCKCPPGDGRKSSFSGSSIDGAECSTSSCGSVWVPLWSTPTTTHPPRTRVFLMAASDR